MNEAAEERFGVSEKSPSAEPSVARTSTPNSIMSCTEREKNPNSIKTMTPQRDKSKTSSRRSRTTSSLSQSEVGEREIKKSWASSSSSSPEERLSKDGRSPDKRTAAVARGRTLELCANKKQRGQYASFTRKEGSSFESRRYADTPKS